MVINRYVLRVIKYQYYTIRYVRDNRYLITLRTYTQALYRHLHVGFSVVPDIINVRPTWYPKGV